MLAAHGIQKSYGGSVVLHDVAVSIERGTITAIIGPNGSGKSTLLRTLALVDPPDAGTVTIDGESYEFPVARASGRPPPWPKITMVFQQLFLWPHLTIRENIALPKSTSDGSDRGDVARLLEQFDLEALADRYPNEVSLGQRQRTALARALSAKPTYLLLDEVTSALDVEQVSVLLGHLKSLRDQGLSIVLVTHMIGFAKQVADRVVFMWKGAVSERGDVSILSAPRSNALKRFLLLLEPI